MVQPICLVDTGVGERSFFCIGNRVLQNPPQTPIIEFRGSAGKFMVSITVEAYLRYGPDHEYGEDGFVAVVHASEGRNRTVSRQVCLAWRALENGFNYFYQRVVEVKEFSRYKTECRVICDMLRPLVENYASWIEAERDSRKNLLERAQSAAKK